MYMKYRYYSSIAQLLIVYNQFEIVFDECTNSTILRLHNYIFIVYNSS